MGKKRKVMILSTYPAPYRMQLFEKLRREFEVDVFFETAQGDERNNDWFYNAGAYILEDKEGYNRYKKACLHIRQYDLVALYEYSTKRACKIMVLCRLLNIPYVINCDGVNLLSNDNKFRNIIKTFFIKGSSGCLASGTNAKKYFLKYGAQKEKIHIHTFTSLNESDILEGVLGENEKYQLREKLNLPLKGRLAIAVGRFIPLKRYDELIRAWKRLPKDYFLLLIGGGSEYERYQSTVKELALENVIIEPFHRKEELFDYYKASDVFVHPTSYDVWGLVVNEAMACGLPIVVSDHCIAGLELVQNGTNGYVVNMGQDDQLCDKVMEIMQDDQLRLEMAKQSISTIKAYTIENMAEKHQNVFDKIISEKGSC